MRSVFVPLLLALCLQAEAKAVPALRGPAPKPATPSATSIWEPLVWPGARYQLVTEAGRPYVEVEVYDARLVKDARVARIRWTYVDGGTRAQLDSSLPTQLAVTKRGAYLLTERADDAQIAALLARKPDYADPPQPEQSAGHYVRKDSGAVCLGIGTPPEAGACKVGEICRSEVCLRPGAGPVSLSGDYAPNRATFKVRQRGAGVTGIVECDELLGRMAACAADPRVPADRRTYVAEQRRTLAARLVPMAQRVPEVAMRQCQNHLASGLAALGCEP